MQRSPYLDFTMRDVNYNSILHLKTMYNVIVFYTKQQWVSVNVWVNRMKSDKALAALPLSTVPLPSEFTLNLTMMMMVVVWWLK